MDVFLSHPTAESKLAERLSKGLEGRGLSVWFDLEKLAPGSNWRHETEKAIHDAGHILLLIGPKEPDEIQQFTWRTALEAVWEDPEKHLIPVLYHGADLPAFVLSGSTRDEIEVLRLEDPQYLQVVIDAIAKIVRGEQAELVRKKKVEIKSVAGKPTTVTGVIEGGDKGKEAGDRSYRLLDLRRRLRPT